MATSNDLIRVEHLTKRFPDGIQALDDCNLSIQKGEVVVIVGPSGSGKSTMLRSLNLLEEPTEGRVIFEGVDLADKSVDVNLHRQRMGMVFQHFNLFPNMTVLKNLTLAPLHAKKEDPAQAEARARALLEKVGLADRADYYPRQLSGGQQQRVAIARALASNPKIMLCDEATSALDTLTTHSILGLLRDINKELGVTMVVITHSLSVAEQICNKVAVIEAGSIAEQGKTADVFGNPQSAATRLLIEADQGFACAKGGN